MKTTLPTGITYTEADAIRAGRILVSKEFIAADMYGYRLENLRHTGAIGVLVGGLFLKEKPLGLLARIFPPAPKRMFLGVIDFQNEDKNISTKKWFFSVYGSANVPMAIQLAQDLVKDTDLSIDLCLMDEAIRYESIYDP